MTIDVECYITNGMLSFVIVGFASKTIDKSKERIRSAFFSAGLSLPHKRIIINFAPADRYCNIVGQQTNRQNPEPKVQFIGELGLDGDIRGFGGIISKLLAASV